MTLNRTTSSSDVISNTVNDYSPFEPGTLAYNILINAKNKTNGTTFVNTPLTKVAEEISSYDEKILSTAIDDYGTTYYYRGNPIDNYVTFADMCWRIIRIAGDGSIKLILEDQDQSCSTSINGNWMSSQFENYYGYTEYASNTLTASDGTKNSRTIDIMNYLNGGTNSDKSMATAFKNFQTGSLASYLDKLKSGDWCLNDKAYASSTNNTTPLTSTEILDKQVKGTTFYYDSYVRLIGKTIKEPTLKCNGTNMKKYNDNTDMYVGTLTADEIVYAGGKNGEPNGNYYLLNNYQKTRSYWFWSLAPSDFYSNGDIAFFVNYDGSLDTSYVSNAFTVDGSGYFRPAVSLKAGSVILSGEGTLEKPYIIE